MRKRWRTSTLILGNKKIAPMKMDLKISVVNNNQNKRKATRTISIKLSTLTKKMILDLSNSRVSKLHLDNHKRLKTNNQITMDWKMDS